MADKRADTDPQAGPFHSFRVTHVTRPGHGAPGSSEEATGLVNAHDALAFIRDVGKRLGLDAKASVHPAHGIPVKVAEALGLEDTEAAAAAEAAWAQGTIAGPDESHAERREEVIEPDDFTS